MAPFIRGGNRFLNDHDGSRIVSSVTFEPDHKFSQNLVQTSWELCRGIGFDIMLLIVLLVVNLLLLVVLFLLIVLFYVLFVCKCVLYCTTATCCQPNCS